MSNIPLKTITFPGLDDTYAIPQVDSTLAVTGAAADAKKTGDEITDLKEALTSVSTTLTHKANKDGVVASAEQLLSDVGTEDKAPYLFRAVPYDSTRVEEEVVGCSVGVNQLIPDASKDFTNSITDTAAAFKVWIGGNANSQEFYRQNITATGNFVCLANATATTAGLRIMHFGGTNDIVFYQKSNQSLASGHKYLFACNFKGIDHTTVGGVVIEDMMFIDLTAWFGSTIADYAYTLEQATAGSGVAWIKQFLPGGYIPFSAPGLKSVEGLTAHVTSGFNQWDEEYLNGYYSSSGSFVSATGQLCSKNMIRVLPDTSYYFKLGNLSANQGHAVCFYDVNKNFLSRILNIYNFTTPSDCFYININLGANYGTTYNHDICINLSDPAKNGTYEPYKEATYALDSDLTLRGILKMDASHNVYADGDVYGSDGTVERRYGVVTLDGSQNFADSAPSVNPNGGYNAWFTYAGAGMSDVKKGSADIEKRSDKFIYAQRTSVSGQQNNIPIGSFSGNVAGSVSNDNWLVFAFDSSFDTYAKIKAWFTANPTIVLYEKDTPTTETADPYASPQNCAVGGTEEYVYGEGGSGVPVGHNSRYQKNLKGELERVSVAVPEVGSTAGTYVLKATVTAQGVTYGWVAE